MRRADLLDVKPKTVGQFYTDEAAYLVSAAAKARQAIAQPRPAPAPAKSAYTEPVLDEPDRAPLTPEPAVNENRPAAYRSAPEFVDQSRRRSLTYASGGNGSPTHLAFAYFLSAAGITAVHVPHKGGQEAVLATVAEAINVPLETDMIAARAAASGSGV